MGTYTGTNKADTITPTKVSAGVIAVPAGSRPSDAADVINGRGGNDSIGGGGGADMISGGDGNDIIFTAGAGNAVHGGDGDEFVEIVVIDDGGATPATNTAWGDDGNDYVFLYYDSDLGLRGEWVGRPTGTITLHGGAGDDEIGITANDSNNLNMAGTTGLLYGEAGNDVLWASNNSMSQSGSFYGGNNPDTLYGGTGNDYYLVFETKDVVIERPGEGYDTVYANNTDYTLSPNVEKLELGHYYNDFPGTEGCHGTGNALDNLIIGWSQNEVLDGLAGNDTIYGSWMSSTDVMLDQDIIHGGGGNDLIYGDASEAPWAGSGDISGRNDDQLYGDNGNDRLFGLYGDDKIYGGAGNDSLAGQADDDTLWGGGGNDHLGGGSGNDRLYGENGLDVLTGRDGADVLNGGSGNDRFVYEAIADSKPGAASHDTILDMAGIGKAGGDVIDLAKIDANTTMGGNQAFTFVGTTAALKAGQLHVVAGTGTNSLIQGEVDGKPGIDFEIAVQDGATRPGDWIAGDFIL